MRFIKTILRCLLCDSTQDPRERRPTRPIMSRPVPQYPHHHHHRQAYDGDDDSTPILTSPVRIRPVPANRPPAPPRVPDRYPQTRLDAESHEQPRRTERPPRPPASTTRRPTANTPAAAPSRSAPRTSDPSRAPPPRLPERSEADRRQLYAPPRRLHERPLPRAREDAARGRPDERHPRRERAESGTLPAYSPAEAYPEGSDERPPTRRRGEIDQGRLDSRREQPRERHVASRRDIFGIDHAPPPPPRLFERPIYEPREVVIYVDDPVSPPPRPVPARHEREHKPLPERLPQPPRATPPTRPSPRAPTQAPLISRPPPPPRPPQAPLPPPAPPLTNLDPTLRKLLTTLHSALSHTHYAISGPLALATWGYSPSPTLPSHPITVLCPADDRAVLRAWAAAAGFGIGSSSSSSGRQNPDEMSVDIPLPRDIGREGYPRPTRRFTVVLHPLPPGEWAVAARGSAVLPGGVRVAGMLGLVEWFAQAFSKALRDGDGRGLGEAGRAVLWLLERVVKGRGGGVIRAEEVPRVVQGVFWRGLVGVFGEEAEDVLGWCGLTMGEDARREKVEVREKSVGGAVQVAEDGVWAALRALEGEVRDAGPGGGGWV